MRIGNIGSNAGFFQSSFTNGAASGATTFTHQFLPRNNANTTITDCVTVQYSKIANNDGGEYLIKTTNSAGTLVQAFYINKDQSVVIGNAAVATNATDGFLYITSCAGTPTGAPTAQTGRTAMVYDTSANKIWFYNGSWRGVVVS